MTVNISDELQIKSTQLEQEDLKERETNKTNWSN
jgi:hypothetical protein